ncbi:MAG: hypothetical protein NT009_01575 [Proteobacteria bacterium]|nr:hypothetical protein [Pseudomonadota bacterium]
MNVFQKYLDSDGFFVGEPFNGLLSRAAVEGRPYVKNIKDEFNPDYVKPFLKHY